MRVNPILLILFISLSFTLSCKQNSSIAPVDTMPHKITVFINDIAYPTESFLRIPYTLSLWEYHKEGLRLEKITVLDNESKAELTTFDKSEIPKIYMEPLPTHPLFPPDKINRVYLSLQVPIPLSQPVPAKITHRIQFKDTVNNKDIIVEGGLLIPRTKEKPILIASPVKGKNWVFINQSTIQYHFYVMFFVNGKVTYGERFAFDNMKLNDDFSSNYKDDPKLNSNHFNYRDTLYAVADGKVIFVKDGMVENNGNSHDHIPTKVEDLGGNYLVLDIGNGHYAFYAHCVPNSFKVKVGDFVNEGQPLALLGNSGNSDAPHLHFQITDGPDILFSRGQPFVLKQYTKIGDAIVGPGQKTTYQNAMMEEMTVMSF